MLCWLPRNFRLGLVARVVRVLSLPTDHQRDERLGLISERALSDFGDELRRESVFRR